MAYTVLARKYRPQSLDDLVGQEHVARTLGNAIMADRVAHAFLFTGVRGVGKTTTTANIGVALALRGRGDHIVTSAVEHPAVLEPCQALAADGYRARSWSARTSIPASSVR